MRVTFKKLFVLLLLLSLAGCMTSKKPAAIEEAFPGLPNGTEMLEEEVVFEEPNPDTGDEIDDEGEEDPDEVCTPVEILTSELPDGAVAGEDYETSIEVRGACYYVTCLLVSGPGWVTMDGCDLHALPNTAESLGEHEITIRAYNMRNESESVERTLTLTVRDDPKINLFVSSSDSPADMKKIQNVNEKERRDFDVTLGQHYFYAQIEGYAEEYDVTIDNSQLSLAEAGDRLYSIALVNPETIPEEPLEVTITAGTEQGTVSRIFNLRFLRDPCLHPLRIEVVKIHQLDETGATDLLSRFALTSIDVELGTKYRILFKVFGAKGPYEWRYLSKIVPEEFLEREEGSRRRVNSRRGGERPYDPLTSNLNWGEILPNDSRWNAFNNPPVISDEEIGQKVYFELETDFSFPGKDLPTVWENGHPVKDHLKVEVETSACRTENGEPEEAEYDLYHNFQLPWESPGDITCEQEMKDVWDTDASEMRIIFKCDNQPCGTALYYINECEGEANEYKCEDPKRVDVDIDPRASVDAIDGVDIRFRDHTSDEDYWDDDYDEVDYDLESFTCYTPFRSIYYEDVDDRFNDDLVHSTWRDIVDADPYEGGWYINVATYPLSFFSFADHGIWTPRLDYPEPTEE